jgi:exosome complex component RRP42
MSSKKSTIIDRLKKSQLTDLLSKGTRLDGRGFLEHRPIVIETGVIDKANGSARVNLGNTQVIAGVKVQVDEPFPDVPEKGLLIVNNEVLPLSSVSAEPGPPNENAIELARVVDRGIRESEMIDLKKLVLIPGKKVLAIFVDVNILNSDGNLFDAASYAVVSSLATSKIEKLNITQDLTIEKTGEFIPLPINTIPISITMARIGESIVVDPGYEEENIMDVRVTYTINDQDFFCAAQKGEPDTLTLDQVKKTTEIALNKTKEIRDIIKRSI